MNTEFRDIRETLNVVGPMKIETGILLILPDRLSGERDLDRIPTGFIDTLADFFPFSLFPGLQGGLTVAAHLVIDQEIIPEPSGRDVPIRIQDKQQRSLLLHYK